MACYPYRCGICGEEKEVIQSIASYSKDPIRPQCCGQEMHRVFTVPMLAPDYAPMRSPVDGSVINSRSEHREHMKRHNLVLFDDVASDADRNRKDAEAKRVKEIKETAVEAIHKVEAGYKPQIIPESQLVPT